MGNARVMQNVRDLVMTEGLGRMRGSNAMSLHMHDALSEFLQVSSGIMEHVCRPLMSTLCRNYRRSQNGR